MSRWTLDYLNACFEGCDSGMAVSRDDSGDVTLYEVRWFGDLDHDVPEEGILVKTYRMEFLLHPHGEESVLRLIASESLGGSWLLYYLLRDLLEHEALATRRRALIHADVLLADIKEDVFFETFGIEERGDEMRLKEDWVV